MISDLYVSSKSDRPPLRVGLLLDTPVLAAALAGIVVDIQRSDFARIELVVYNGSANSVVSPPESGSRLATLWRVARDSNRRADLGWALYTKADQRFSRVEEDPLAGVDCTPLLEGVEVMRVEPITKRFVHRFPDDALDVIRAKRLDVLLRFGFNILRGGILTAAKYGVWSFHHGDNDYYRGGPAHFWEMHEHNPLSGAMLQILTEELDGGRVLVKGLFATESGMSLRRNRVQPYWGSAHFVMAKLWELHRFGWEHVEARALVPTTYLGRRKIYRRPENLEIARWAVPQILSRAGRRVWRAATGMEEPRHWRIAIRMNSSHYLWEEAQPDMRGFQWIESPNDRFYADPFLIAHEGKHWVFFEEYRYSEERGVIACAELTEEGAIGSPPVALDTGKHASYPYIFRDGDSIYMIPETMQQEAVSLYRCVRFPDKWEIQAELFRGPAVDTSVWTQDGLWWFFVTLVERRGWAIGLYLFFSESLTGNWQYHPSNPISLDVRNARGAGAIQHRGGRLIRPSQDGSKRYGYAVNFREITQITPERYEERPLVTVRPSWHPSLLAMHTYNRLGNFEIIDGLTRGRSKIRNI